MATKNTETKVDNSPVAEEQALTCTAIQLTDKEIHELVEEADDRFSHVGGTKYEYIHQVFFPLLKEKGYTICICK